MEQKRTEEIEKRPHNTGLSHRYLFFNGFDDCFAVCVRRAEVQNSTAVIQLNFCAKKPTQTLADKESIDNLARYFFYNFLETTNDFKYLTTYFKNPFKDTLNFFEKLKKEKK